MIPFLTDAQVEEPKIRRVFLIQGSVCITARPTLVTTVLGSCIAACLWDSICGIGAMNHFVLPHTRGHERSARYGDVAMERIVKGLLDLGCRLRDLRAKVFGGANVLPVGANKMTIGAQNVDKAMEILKAYGIPVIAQHTGGRNGLFIRFNTSTGSVTLRRMSVDQDRKLPSGFDYGPPARHFGEPSHNVGKG